MRRHIDEDEPSAANRRRNKAADTRHGFGSPLGMELTGLPTDQVGQQHDPRQEDGQDSNKEVQLQEYHDMQALADLDSPPPNATWSTESETPTPPALRESGRQSPPDVFELLMRPPATSTPNNTQAGGGPIRQPLHTSKKTDHRRERGEQGVALHHTTSEQYVVSPAPSIVSQTFPTLRPNSYASPLTLQALRSPAELPPRSSGRSFGSFGAIQAGTPSTGRSGFTSRLSEVTTTPERARKFDYNDSPSNSDTDITAPFSDQVKSLNKLLLSTDKRLGALGLTRSPETDNDDLSREEEDLEEIRRHLQQELAMVDYSVLEDTPGTSKSGSRRSRRSELFPDDEQIDLASLFSTPGQSKAWTPERSSLQTDTPTPRPTITNTPLSTIKASSAARKQVSPSDGSSSLSTSTRNDGSQAHSLSSGSGQSSNIIPPPRPTVKATGSPTELQQKKGSPPTRVLIPTQVLRQKDGNSIDKNARRDDCGEQQQTPSKASQVVDAATAVSHDRSKKSSSSGSCSSGRSSKSLLERIGFRKSGASTLAKEAGKKVASESGSTQSPDPTGGESSTGRGDSVSSSPSEDSIVKFEDQHGRSKSTQGTRAVPNKMGLTPLSQTIRRFEKQIDGSPEKEAISSPTLRREIAPEPPLLHFESEPTKGSQFSQTNPSGGAQAVVYSWDSFFSSVGVQEKQTSCTQSLLPKTVERSDTVSSIEAGSPAFPSDEREISRENIRSRKKDRRASTRQPIYAVPIAIPRVEDEFLSDRPPTEFGRVSSPSSIGSARFPSDERDPSPEDLWTKNITCMEPFPINESRSSHKKNNVNREPSSSSKKDQTLEASSLSLTPHSLSSSKKGSIGPSPDTKSKHSGCGQSTSPTFYKDDNPDQDVEIVFTSSDSTTKIFFSSSGEETTVLVDAPQLAGSYSDDMDQKKQGRSADDQHKKIDGTRKMKLSFFLLLLFGAGATFSLVLLFTIGRAERAPPPATSPSISLMPVTAPIPAPTAMPANASHLPTISQPTMHTGSPTKHAVSFDSAYQIVVWDGGVNDIPQTAYKDNLIESMDRLLSKMGGNIPFGSNRVRRRLQVALLPSSIRDFVPVNCPKLDTQDRCEIVIATITLEDAEDTWADFKLALELQIAIGGLQGELDQVNPDSPVAIIDMVEDPEPSLSPTEPLLLFPSQGNSSSELDLLPFLIDNSFDNGVALMDEFSPQYQAYLWLSSNAQVGNYTEDRLLQRYALATFYFSTHGENWFFQELWLSNEDECLWYSKSSKLPCNELGQMQNLELDYNNVDGVLPPELGLLSNAMERIVLRGGPASFSGGTIPSELGLLTGMTHFFLTGNLYSGTIPTELGGWTALEQFDLSRNNLSGVIPTQFGAFGGLNVLNLSKNRFTGRIPTELGSLTQCQWLNFEGNMLTGPIPTEIGNLRRLQSLHGGSNMLTSMPTELGLLTFLDTLSLSENLLSVRIPTEIGHMPRLILLELSDNALTGPIPSELGNLFDMRDRIDLSFNHLTGPLPSELGNLARLRVLDLEHNKLSGTIPSEIAGLSRITTIRLNTNDFVGTIPNEVCLVFNQTFPAFSADCSEFFDNCPCCTACCVDDGACECRYTQSPDEFLCYQQKRAI